MKKEKDVAPAGREVSQSYGKRYSYKSAEGPLGHGISPIPQSTRRDKTELGRNIGFAE